MKQPKNWHLVPLHVAHSSLPPTIHGNSLRRKCPVCKKGYLLLRRDKEMRLMAEDNCINCGQHFVYTDIEHLRELPLEKTITQLFSQPGS